MTLQLTPAEILGGLGALVAVVMVWRASSRAARRAAETARTGARLMSLTGRVVLTAAVIVGVQWLVITHPGNTTLLLVVLGLPDLLASYALTKALTVAAVDTPPRRGGRR
jgi:hypothetical protein